MCWNWHSMLRNYYILLYNSIHVCWYNMHTLSWLYFALKIICTLLFRAVLISYAPHIVYEMRVKISLLIFVRSIFVRTAAYKIKIEYEIKSNYGRSEGVGQG